MRRAACAVLALAACGGDPAQVRHAASPAPGEVTFSYRPPPGAPAVTTIGVAGGFNDWATGGLPMTRRADGVWQARTTLETGRHEYKFFIDGAWPADMCGDPVWGDPQNGFWIDVAADECVADGHGGRNAVRVVDGPSRPAVGLGFRHHADSAAYVSAAGGALSVRFVAHRGHVRHARVVGGADPVAMHRQLWWGDFEVWRAVLPQPLRGYRFELETAEGSRAFGPYTAPADPFTALEWVGDAVGYQIFPDRFWNGDRGNDSLALISDAYHLLHPSHRHPPPVLTPGWGGAVLEFHCCHQYFGGDLQGVIDRLDHLESLGVTLIYLNPIFLSGSAHGYDTYDYRRVAPRLGDERTLRALLDAAAARGMRLMWDFVPNHVGVGHAAFRSAVQEGEGSRYWNWFGFRVPAADVEVGNGRHYDAWSGFGSLPKLDTREPEVFDFLIEVARHWTRFGFHGIRVDVPNEIANRAEFFGALRAATRAVDPETYLVGEIWGRSPGWLQGDQFDALMNYAVGRDVVRGFAAGELPAPAAADAMARVYAEYPEASVAMLFNLISSHDTARLLTDVGGGPLGGTPDARALARHRLAAAMLYALPGVPVTFQGDECAFLGAGDGPREENRYPFQWDACSAGMLEHYRRLARLRASIPALRSPALRLHHAEGSLLAWLRGEPGTGEVLAVFNGGEVPATFPLPPGSWVDDAGTPAEGGSSLPPLDWRYLTRR